MKCGFPVSIIKIWNFYYYSNNSLLEIITVHVSLVRSKLFMETNFVKLLFVSFAKILQENYKFFTHCMLIHLTSCFIIYILLHIYYICIIHAYNMYYVCYIVTYYYEFCLDYYLEQTY